MRHFIFLALFLATSFASAADWVPPANPNPQTILQEAEKDRVAKKYEDALAKLVWIHENSVSVQPSFSGVRLSFAINTWYQLAEKYPPAMKKFEELRDKATESVKEGKKVIESFQDLATINRSLSQQSKTKEMFLYLDEKKPKIAKQVFAFAKPALIDTEQYKLYAKYIDPKNDLINMVTVRNLITKPKAEKGPHDQKQINIANNTFTRDVATLVAILVVNDRKDEAEVIAASARQEWKNKIFHMAIDDALQGNVPLP